MPFYSPERLRELRGNNESTMTWWRIVRGLLQTFVVLWLITRFFDTNLFAHVTVCFAVIVIAELRLHHLRSSYHAATLGLVSWHALRALHERLDAIHAPTDGELSDDNTDIGATPFEPVKPMYWKDRIAVPLDRWRVGAATSKARHWGTKLLHRELGNIELARAKAGSWGNDRDGTGMPEVEIDTGDEAAFAYSAMAKLAIVWALVVDWATLPTLWWRAAALVMVGLALAMVIYIAQRVPEQRQRKEALAAARERGIQEALAKMRNAETSIWNVRSLSASASGVVTVCFDGSDVEIYHGDRFVFRGCVSDDRSRLRWITFFDDGDWIPLLRDGDPVPRDATNKSAQ